MNLVDAIEKRRSIRKYKQRPVAKEIIDYVVKAGRKAIPLVPEINFRLYTVWNASILPPQADGLSSVYGMPADAPHYIIAVSQNHPRCMENIGFCMEQLILYATACGLGTCWIGGTFSEKRLLDFAPDLSADEQIVAFTPLGYADDSQPAQMARQMLQWSSASDSGHTLKPLTEFVSQDIFVVPWDNQKDATLKHIFELTGMAPSWADTQPWHFIVDDKEIIALVDRTPQKGNVHEGKPYYRLDGGIAMCHFYLTAREAGWKGHWQSPKKKMYTRYGIPDTHDILGGFQRG